MKRILVIILIAFSCISCSQKNWESTTAGIVLYPKNLQANLVQAIRIMPLNNEVVKVSVSATKSFSDTESLFVLPDSNRIPFDINQKGDKLLISTAEIKVEVSIATGEIQFFNENGKLLLQEKKGEGNTLTSIVAESTSAFSIQQVFESTAEEAIYLAAQHRTSGKNGQGKIEGQSNTSTKASVPFAISTKNYGLLLENHSKSLSGDSNIAIKASSQAISNSKEIYLISETEKQIDYYFIKGNSMDEVISHYRDLRGKIPILPKRALDFLTDKECIASTKTTETTFSGHKKRQSPIASNFKGCLQWDDIKSRIPSGINSSIIDIPNWAIQMGDTYDATAEIKLPEEWRELNTRIYQFNTFAPLFRVSEQLDQHDIPTIASKNHPSFQTMLYCNKLRHSLMPYIYSIAGAVYHSNYTAMRSLAMDFNHDRRVLNIDDQFMFGSSLLVNPVYKYKARKRDVYFPNYSGWFNLYTGEYLAGGQKLSIDSPYERMPVFVREGSIIPTDTESHNTDDKQEISLDIFVYTGKDAFFNLYEDDGISNAYESGEFSLINFNYSEKEKTLTINDREGKFDGMNENRIFNVIKVTRHNPVAFLGDSYTTEKIHYTGDKKVTKLD